MNWGLLFEMELLRHVQLFLLEVSACLESRVRLGNYDTVFIKTQVPVHVC